jgi:antitoxin HigA-1
MTTIGAMHNPPHPGEFIRELYLSELQMSIREVASKLQVAPSTLNRILQERSRVTPEMALRLSRCLGRSAESWLAMQDAYDLWHARQQLDLSALEPVIAATA